ncbi:MAG: glycosyltransferase family 4 protein, partial [Acidimicrobiales bacterium]
MLSDRRPPLHVRLATWDDDPAVGGQGVYIRELRSALEGLGLEVTTMAGHGPHAIRFPRLTGLGHIDMSVALNRSPGILVDGDTDLVHASGGPGGLQLLRRLPVPLVYTAYHTYAQSHRRWSPKYAYGAIEMSAYRRASMVAAISPSTAESLREMGVPSPKIMVISPGVHIGEAGPDLVDGSEPGRVLFVGRLETEKGPLDALETMRQVVAVHPGARGYVAGSGSLEPQVRQVVDGPAGHQITFLGRISDQQVAQEMRRAQVVIVPSAFEGLGLVALEAMAGGAAVVGYDV